MLQQNGYNSQQIFDAFNQADQKSTAVAGPVQGMEEEDSEDDIPSGNTEAIVESLVQEKWKELQDKMQAFEQWKDDMDSKVHKIEESVNALKESFNNLHQGVLGKISEYDTNLKDVGSSVKAMDKVFKNVLPTLTESVSKLGRITGVSPKVEKPKSGNPFLNGPSKL